MRSLAVIAALFLATLVAGCGLLPEVKDETIGWSANKLYTEAKDAMSDGGYAQAIKYFEKLESRYPYGRFAQQAQIDIAYAYWKDNELPSATAACDRFIKLHPNHPNVDYVYYLRGLINFNEDLGLFAVISQQDMTERDPKGARESFDSFKELVTHFPDSKYTPDARYRMQYLLNTLATSEIHVADYYLRRGAYVAAANRAKGVLIDFPQTPQTLDALQILVQAYDAMGMKDLRDDTKRILALNETKIGFRPLVKESPLNPTPWWKFWD